ncbi:TrkA family potassium uptake protein [Halovenus sp. WSH3]|uniref:TrkA family potassium uptake protein n=1 Tax=Halovenus carboxidivorans TaxID=2692199 RepID=A0A6B0T1E5_9EURY|nr:TrkA family potassium uptake protein [Halovenus carboxidivorans]MXR52028.1 TrkA family potassium uptake protein [Halovenus carboxidivorans]
MKFVIVGFGRVGMRTAQNLRAEGHDVVVVEQDPDRVERARTDGFKVIQGDGSTETTLERANLDETDALGGLTGDLNTNFLACVIGDAHGCRTVLRVNEDFSDELYEKYADSVDEIIYPERLGAVGAKTALLGGDFDVIADLTEELAIASVEIPEGAPVVGKRVVEVDLPGETRIYAHGRGDEPMSIPLPRTRIEAGDSLAILADPDALADVRAALRGGAVAE